MQKDNRSIPALIPSPVLESGREAVHTLLRNSTFYLGADAAIKVLGFAFSIFVVRQLGDERLGFYNTALAYASIFSIIGDLGMTQYATREIARRRRQADDLFWNLVIIRLILSAIATLFITASAYYVAGYRTEMVIGIFMVCIGFFVHAFLGPIQIILDGHERIDRSSIFGTIVQLFFVSVGTWVLLHGYPFHFLILASYIGVPIAAVVGFRSIKRLKLATFKFHITPTEWLPILQRSLPFALITFTLMSATSFDTVFLSLWRTPEEVGWYGAAYTLIFKLLFIKGALLTTLHPQLSRYYSISKDRVGIIFNASFKVLLAFSFPIALGATMLANPLIIWLYTDEFVRSGPVLAILIWALPLMNLSALCGSVTIASDREKQAVKVHMTAALLNIGTNLIAIPIWGYIGAAISTVLTEAVALILFYLMLRTEFPLTDLANSVFKPVLAGVIMAGVILVMPGWPVVFLIFIGASVYVVALLGLRPFNQSELEMVENLWGSLRSRIGWRMP